MKICAGDTIHTIESQVRSYSRSWPVIFDQAEGCWISDDQGNQYLDFFAGAGALNYGHNNPTLKGALLDYLCNGSITHSLDMNTVAKNSLLECFGKHILEPRSLDYRVQFTSPTGSSAVEAALELARKVTGRKIVLGFENAFHGMTLGSMAVSDNRISRSAHGSAPDRGFPLVHGELDQIEEIFSSRTNRPAAVIVETVQGEGGVNIARDGWLNEVRALCTKYGVLLIVDDVQVGCGRTGPFFSFEGVDGVVPDIVCLSKSIGGFGLPLALTLIRRDLDIWRPGEHSGTFRGNNLAFVTAAAAIETYWADGNLETETIKKGNFVRQELARVVGEYSDLSLAVRGVGLINGLVFSSAVQARAVCKAAFEVGLLLESAGRNGEVVKLMPPLTITNAEVARGLALLREAIASVFDTSGRTGLKVGEVDHD
ncbi:diaminobutyrate--2-oxoglutarate transaminase [Rhodococcus sp. NPDC060176]|uniref:diaminobutyrate--2-oxoglutarate transaminase n=1 Tax=Rhodococcus sp. NPDC060176 TaxID=3347062 RepID=UPI003662FB72